MLWIFDQRGPQKDQTREIQRLQPQPKHARVLNYSLKPLRQKFSVAKRLRTDYDSEKSFFRKAVPELGTQGLLWLQSEEELSQ